jgi:hypothetical protein
MTDGFRALADQLPAGNFLIDRSASVALSDSRIGASTVEHRLAGS